MRELESLSGLAQPENLKEFYLQNAPMAGQLGFPGERPPPTDGLYETSRHELRHACVALAMGVNPTFISVKRDGNSLGRTGFDGTTSLGKFKIIAAAGAVNPSGFGHAPGSGMDLYQVSVANYLQGENPSNVAPYIAWAQTILDANFSENVLDRAANILASLGHVDGPDIIKVLDQAEFELKMENLFFVDSQKQLKAVKKVESELDVFLSQEPDQIKIASIEEDKDHDIIIKASTKEEPDKLIEKKVCPLCGPVENGHNPNCKFWSKSLINGYSQVLVNNNRDENQIT